jgi:nitrate reductase NapAB chaperone NapD
VLSNEIAGSKDGRSATVGDRSPQLEVYSVVGIDPNAALKVLQTLLTGLPDVRLEVERTSGNLVAIARPAQHATIKATLEQLQRDARRVEVIQLQLVDPQVAALAITKLFTGGAEGGAMPPSVDINPANRQLLVRGSEGQIKQIKGLLEKMGETNLDAGGVAESRNVRLLPLTGRTARAALEKIQEVWPSMMRQNPIRVVTPSAPPIPSVRSGGAQDSRGSRDSRESGGVFQRPFSDRDNAVEAAPGAAGRARSQPESPSLPASPERPERSTLRSHPRPSGTAPIHMADEATERDDSRVREAEPPSALPAPRSSAPTSALPAAPSPAAGEPKTAFPAAPPRSPAVAERASSAAAPPIIVVPGASGLMIASQDVEALNAFERLLTRLAASVATSGRQVTVFYLRYAKAPVVGETLDQILGGGTGASATGPAIGEFSRTAPGDATGGVVDSLQGNRVIPTGPVQITPDPRLNALIVRASPADLDTIEEILKILDQKDSPEEILANARPRIIPVLNTSADDVADVVRQVYQDRLTSGTGSGGGGMPGGGPGPGFGGFGGFGGGGFGGFGGGGFGGPRFGGGGGGPNPQLGQMMRGIRRAMGTGMARARAEEPQKMSVSVDSRTNSLIVCAPETLFDEVKKFVAEMDNSARQSAQVMRVVTLDHSSPLAIQQALGALMGSSVQMGSVATGGAGTRATGAQPSGRYASPGQGMRGGGGPAAAAQAPGGGGYAAPAAATGPDQSGGGGFRGRFRGGSDGSSPGQGNMPFRPGGSPFGPGMPPSQPGGGRGFQPPGS